MPDHTSNIKKLLESDNYVNNLLAFEIIQGLEEIPDETHKLLTQFPYLCLKYGILTPIQHRNVINLVYWERKYNERLSNLPHHTRKLKQLQSLNLDRHQFQKWPLEIFELKNLQKLSFSQNILENIPDDISKLQSLESLIF